MVVKSCDICGRVIPRGTAERLCKWCATHAELREKAGELADLWDASKKFLLSPQDKTRMDTLASRILELTGPEHLGGGE